VAARKSEQPLYLVFLARVIHIEAVQRHRAAVTDDYTSQFFSAGCPLGSEVEFRWSLDRPEASGEPVASASLAMQHAWDAAVVAFKEFINVIINGELIASGMPPATGVRRDLEPSEWTRSDQVLDVLNGDLIDVRYGNHVRWSNINLRAAKPPRQNKTRGHGHDWAGVWAYALTLRTDDQWDWTKYRRDNKQPLPAVHKVVEDKIKNWFQARGNVPNIRDIRQNVIIPLYAGRRTRNKRKR
jgi:hypothetical protein